jgi:hypothetical protein
MFFRDHSFSLFCICSFIILFFREIVIPYFREIVIPHFLVRDPGVGWIKRFSVAQIKHIFLIGRSNDFNWIIELLRSTYDCCFRQPTILQSVTIHKDRCLGHGNT